MYHHSRLYCVDCHRLELSAQFKPVTVWWWFLNYVAKKLSLMFGGSGFHQTSWKTYFITNLYQKLYTSSFDPQSCHIFLDKVSPLTPKVFRELWALWKSITAEKYQSVITKMPSNKSPGPDGLPYEFYVTFWEDLKHVGSFCWMCDNNELIVWLWKLWRQETWSHNQSAGWSNQAASLLV